MNSTAFHSADILIPKDCDMHKWSVIACDQYTSEPEYWDAVTAEAGGAAAHRRPGRSKLPQQSSRQGDPGPLPKAV